MSERQPSERVKEAVQLALDHEAARAWYARRDQASPDSRERMDIDIVRAAVELHREDPRAEQLRDEFAEIVNDSTP